MENVTYYFQHVALYIVSVSTYFTDLSPSHLSVYVCLCVGLSVCPESVLWQNGWYDPDAIWDGERRRELIDFTLAVVIVGSASYAL